jgi:hypothetical protein
VKQPRCSASGALVRLKRVPDDADVLSELDPILAAADTSQSPWEDGQYRSDLDMARRLLAVPIGAGMADEQQTGRAAKALDAWIAHELRRAGFPPDAVWPRTKRPRVLPADLVEAEELVATALARLEEFEDRLTQYSAAAAARGLTRNAPSLYRVRPAISNIGDALGSSATNVLGQFYVKQVDVVVSTWQRGPDVLVSTKTQFSSYLNNKNNRYEEAVGEATNLRNRYPMAAMGFVFLVRSNVFNERGAFAYLRNQLARLRKPDGAFDATMLLVADWDEDLNLGDIEDPVRAQAPPDEPEPILSAPRFFRDLLDAVMNNSPVDIHTELRLRKLGEPEGGMPPEEEDVAPEEAG